MAGRLLSDQTDTRGAVCGRRVCFFQGNTKPPRRGANGGLGVGLVFGYLLRL